MRTVMEWIMNKCDTHGDNQTASITDSERSGFACVSIYSTGDESRPAEAPDWYHPISTGLSLRAANNFRAARSFLCALLISIFCSDLAATTQLYS
uniref:CBL06 n=1 Tax=Arundo donax TaxID=35708 RepID=A0A0A9NN27_ARUDO